MISDEVAEKHRAAMDSWTLAEEAQRQARKTTLAALLAYQDVIRDGQHVLDANRNINAPLLRALAKHGFDVQPYHITCRECGVTETYTYDPDSNPLLIEMYHEKGCIVRSAQIFVINEVRKE